MTFLSGSCVSQTSAGRQEPAGHCVPRQEPRNEWCRSGLCIALILNFFAANAVDHFTVGKDGLAHDPGANRPAGECFAVPGGPAAFGQLIGVADGLFFLKIK